MCLLKVMCQRDVAVAATVVIIVVVIIVTCILAIYSRKFYVYMRMCGVWERYTFNFPSFFFVQKETLTSERQTIIGWK